MAPEPIRVTRGSDLIERSPKGPERCMVPWLRTLAALVEDLGRVPSTCMTLDSHSLNPVQRGSDVFF